MAAKPRSVDAQNGLLCSSGVNFQRRTFFRWIILRALFRPLTLTLDDDTHAALRLIYGSIQSRDGRRNHFRHLRPLKALGFHFSARPNYYHSPGSFDFAPAKIKMKFTPFCRTNQHSKIGSPLRKYLPKARTESSTHITK